MIRPLRRTHRIIFFALVSVVAFTSYAFIGIGKFASVFLPSGLSPNTYGIILVALTTLYTVMGGFYSVVFTDVVQFFLKTAACLAIGVIAMARVSPAALASCVPSGWMDIGFGWRLDIDWSRLLPSVGMRIAKDGYSMFGAFFMMMLFKGILVSGAGPAPNYDMQRILACRSPREASFMSGLVSVVLFPARYFMIAGITVLALVYLRPAIAAQGVNIDFEQILPLVIRDFVPAGLAGLLIAGFLAAFMSTFAGTINAAAAYIVNDIYKRYVNSGAPDKTYVRASYLASTLVVIVGCGLGYFMTSIHSITEWIVAALWGGYAAPNLLKWHWWRFNGHGYFWGMMVGVLGALVLATFPSVSPIMAFPVLFAASTLASIAGSLATPPVDKPTLAAFYLRTRPWGWWKPIEETARRTHPGFVANTGFRRDMVNVVVGIVWQTSLVAMAIYTVLKNWTGVLGSVALVAVCSFVLKKNWLDKMEADNTCDLAISPTSVANMSSRKTS